MYTHARAVGSVCCSILIPRQRTIIYMTCWDENVICEFIVLTVVCICESKDFFNGFIFIIYQPFTTIWIYFCLDLKHICLKTHAKLFVRKRQDLFDRKPVLFFFILRNYFIAFQYSSRLLLKSTVSAGQRVHSQRLPSQDDKQKNASLMQ